MLTGKAFEATAMAISFLLFCGSYLLVVWKDKSWINWATPAFFFSVGAKYAFQFVYLCVVAPSGSHYAYFFCYATYALSALTGSLVYAFIKPITLRTSPSPFRDVGYWPWILLLAALFLYLPVLIAFRAYLDNPRQIYAMTRTGYGIWFFGSIVLADLAFIVSLFQKKKSRLGSVMFYTTLGLLTYWHGSKGLILTYALIWMLYYVYVEHKNVTALSAFAILAMASVLVIGMFAIFENKTDVPELLVSVTGYADYVRNAMLVIDDNQSKQYYGRLTLESEIYSRVPRILMPDKPKDFGPILLAKIYYPGSYRSEAGAPAFDLGVQYADFGPFSMVLACSSSSLTAWILSSAAATLRRFPTPGLFLVFLCLAGVSIFATGAGSNLLETSILAMLLSRLLRFRLMRKDVNYVRP